MEYVVRPNHLPTPDGSRHRATPSEPSRSRGYVYKPALLDIIVSLDSSHAYIGSQDSATYRYVSNVC